LIGLLGSGGIGDDVIQALEEDDKAQKRAYKKTSGSYKMIIDTNIYRALDRGDPRVVSILQSKTSIMIPFCVLG
jgi:hypothetical protein